MDKLLRHLRRDVPGIRFTAGKDFCWSPASQQVIYPAGAQGPAAIFSLLHETGHALCGHARYRLDAELLGLEVDAWERARGLAADYGIVLDEDHIQDCLDTYRDWLYRRSICPSCTTKALQADSTAEYRCHNCYTTWRVASSRFCRPYRQSKGLPKAPPLVFAASK